MKSKAETFANIPNDQKLVMSKAMVGHGLDIVTKSVDEMSSSNLKRIIKILSHTHFAEEVLGRELSIKLEEKEQKLIDSIFALHETLLGHQALVKELEEQSGLGSVNMTASLQENNNE